MALCLQIFQVDYKDSTLIGSSVFPVKTIFVMSCIKIKMYVGYRLQPVWECWDGGDCVICVTWPAAVMSLCYLGSWYLVISCDNDGAPVIKTNSRWFTLPPSHCHHDKHPCESHKLSFCTKDSQISLLNKWSSVLTSTIVWWHWSSELVNSFYPPTLQLYFTALSAQECDFIQV